MKINKWIIIGVMVLIVMLTVLSSCSGDDVTTKSPSTQPVTTTSTVQKPEPTYEIKEKDGEQYIVIHNLNVETPSGGVIPNYLIYDSFAQMKDTVKNQKFTRSDLETMQLRFPKKADGTIPICRIDTMQMPILPSGALPDYPICWYGEWYEFGILLPEYGEKAFCFFSYQTKNVYQKAYEDHYKDTDDERYTVRELKDRDAVELVSQNGRVIQYSFTANGAKYLVQEEYISYQDSDDAPYKVRVFVNKGNQYYMLSFYKLEKILSAEWLSSFDIQPIPDNLVTE